MGFFDRFSAKKAPRCIVLGLDGMPFSFLMKEIERGTMPNLQAEFKKGGVNRMTSAMPPISSVAWSTFMTGRNPAGHNIFGFVDRNPETMELFIPTAKNMRAPTIWETLSRAGKKVAVSNVPVTFPPKEVNGVLVGGFLSTELDRAVYPVSFVQTLKSLDYRIDVDAWEAHSDLSTFIGKLHEVLDRRFRTFNYFYDELEWDFLMTVIMETDRLYHFYWEHYDSRTEKRYDEFIEFHRKLDDYIGGFLKKVRDDDNLIILSDHGFCTLRNEFNLNVFLRDQGFLVLREGAKGLDAIDPSSKAYSLIPGRIFINLKGREKNGSVEPHDYEQVRDEVIQVLKEVRTPDGNEEFWEGIYRREEIYKGDYFDRAADLVALPKDGYEVKGGFKMGELWSKDKFVGTHTYSDAFVYVRNGKTVRNDINIKDLAPTIFSMHGLQNLPETEGRAIL